MLNEDYFAVHSHRLTTFLQYLLSNTILVLFQSQEEQRLLEAPKYFASAEQASIEQLLREQFAWVALHMASKLIGHTTCGTPCDSSVFTLWFPSPKYPFHLHKQLYTYLIMFFYSKQFFQGPNLKDAES